MKRILFACSLVILQPLVLAIDISVGTTRLAIPAPPGFAPITGDMKPYAEFVKRFIPPSNEQFALFLPSADAATAASGGIPDSERKFYVQTVKEMVQPFLSAADFAELKRMIKTQNAEIMKEAQAKMPDFLNQVNKGITDDFHVDPKLAMMQMLPFPPHYETERGLAYSMLLRMNADDKDGKPTLHEGVVTATFVYLQGKILFLYASAEKSGLDWSRAESKKWADMVIAANPSVGEVAVRENSQRRSGIDWNEVGRKAIVGAVIGGIVSLLALAFRKKKG